MDPVILVGGTLAAAAAGVGLGTGLRLLPCALRANRDLREYQRSPEAQRERRFSEIRKKQQLLAAPIGAERETSIIGLDGNTIRHKDGSFSRFYEVTPQETMLAPDGVVDRFCDDNARLLCLSLPKDTVFQWRYSVSPDPGLSIADHLNDLQARGRGHIYLPAARLHYARLDFYRSLAAAGAFRRERALLSVRIPVKLKSDQEKSFANAFVPELVREIGSYGTSGATDALRSAWRRSKNDGVIRRYVDEEREALNQAEKYFRLVELHGQSYLRPLDRKETWEALVLGHCLDRTCIPSLPDVRGLDISHYLTSETIEDRPGYVMHGQTPVMMMSLDTPPNPRAFADSLRLLLANTELTFRHSLVSEFVILDKKKAKSALKTRIDQVKLAKDGFKLSHRQDDEDHDAQKALKDLNDLLYDIAGTNEALVYLRFYIPVYGRAARNRAELGSSLKELDENCEKLIRAIQSMDGAEASRESETALHCLYLNSLPGEADARPTGREQMEGATSLAAFIPRETAFRGSSHPHTIMSTRSGRLTRIDLFDKSLLRSPIILFLAAPGSGKTTLVVVIANDALASIPDLHVSAIDNGETLLPWAQVIGARYLCLSPHDERTFNSFDTPGLMEGHYPDDADLALITMETLVLAGYSLDDRDSADLITNAAKIMLTQKADRNAVSEAEDKVEPTLKDLAHTLENYPDRHEELKAHAARIATRLKKYVSNKWLDAPTHPDFKRDGRCDIYELKPLERFAEDIKRALAIRMGARMMRANCQRRADGTKIPAIQMFVEVWKIVADYPDLLKVIRQGGRTGRRDNIVTMLDTHSYDDLKEIHDITATAGLKFIGPQNKNFDSLIRDAQLNDRAIAAINSIKNIDGLYTQWVMVAGCGRSQQVEVVQADLCPQEFWTTANNPHEWNARQRVLALQPEWTMNDAVDWLAEHYPQGLTAEGLMAIDERLLVQG